MKQVWFQLLHWGYKGLTRPLMFLASSEVAHRLATAIGERLGRSPAAKRFITPLLRVNSPSLESTVAGIKFANPLGLAAGFDYQARLTGILPALGFGWHTVGTITNQPFAGNPPPQLGRLVGSRSLLVNKGLKNDGIHATLQRLARAQFSIPTGISIGKTNSPRPMSLDEAITDVVSAFGAAEKSPVSFSYYELNISCPNLLDESLSFYQPHNLKKLLTAVTKLNLRRPLFVKMPINESDESLTAMLNVIVEHPIRGVIIGNLQRDRQHPTLLPAEVAKCGRGNFSGRPTRERSEALIRLAYRLHGGRLAIIGCGGVFNARDAYRKIRGGASLIQLITGLVFEGPQLVSQINLELTKLLRADGFSCLAEAVGTDHHH